MKGARLEYTRPLRLQHRRYFTQKVFEVTPLEPEVDDFLPFWWISQHPPRGVWESDEIRSGTYESIPSGKQMGSPSPWMRKSPRTQRPELWDMSQPYTNPARKRTHLIWFPRNSSNTLELWGPKQPEAYPTTRATTARLI